MNASHFGGASLRAFSELLEHRTMLSTSDISIVGPFDPGVVTPTPGVRSTLDARGTLLVQGTGSADQVQLVASGPFIVVQSRTGDAFRSRRFLAARVQRIRVIGAGGDDRLSMGSGINRGASLLGGEGDDTLIGGNGFRSDTLSGGPGDDVLVGVMSRQRISVNPLSATAASPTLGDIMVGGSGDDVIFGSGGFDQVAGGDGFDTYAFALRETGSEPIVQEISPATGGANIQVFNDGRPAVITIPIVEVESLTRSAVSIKD